MKNKKSPYLEGYLLTVIEGSPDPLSARQVLRAINGTGLDTVISEDDLKDAFSSLEEQKVVRGYHDKYALSRFEISENGRKFVAEQSNNRDGMFYRIRRFGNGYLYEALENIEKEKVREGVQESGSKEGSANSVPASDRIVPLDHNRPEYKEAVSALDKALAEFKKDHRLDNELGAEKGALLKTLEAGRELLNDTRIRANTAFALIVEPLKIVMARYDSAIVGGVVGALAKEALDLIIKLFGG